MNPLDIPCKRVEDHFHHVKAVHVSVEKVAAERKAMYPEGYENQPD